MECGVWNKSIHTIRKTCNHPWKVILAPQVLSKEPHVRHKSEGPTRNIYVCIYVYVMFIYAMVNKIIVIHCV